MARRSLNPRLIKMHRTYTVEEAARVWGLHRNTIRHWKKNGLRTIDDRKPELILGRTLIEFVCNKRTKNKCPCGTGQLYCMRCRLAKTPAAKMVDYCALTATSGNLIGICPDCYALMYRRVSLAKLYQVASNLDVTIAEAQGHIVDSPCPSVNSDFP